MRIGSWFGQLRDAAALLGVVMRYYACIAIRVRRELRRWRRRALQIRDPVLRHTALAKLGGEFLNTEAAAVFATLAPRHHRSTLIELIVAFEVMYDYLDAVSEMDAADALASGLQLHCALSAAIVEPLAPVDFYAHHPLSGDDGYLVDLAAFCRRRFTALPGAASVRDVAVDAVERCGQGQSRTHAAGGADEDDFRVWTRSLAGASASGYLWWELAAGSASSLGVHALFAAAADPWMTRDEALRWYGAYFPGVCALSTLLDSLIDYEEDHVTGTHSYVAYYGTPRMAAERLAFVARDADEAVRALRRGRRHAVLGSGVAGFYLSAVEARGSFANSAREAVLASLSPTLVRTICAIAQAKRGR
jgi:tetraprenyl-beta-curcumene synthase